MAESFKQDIIIEGLPTGSSSFLEAGDFQYVSAFYSLNMGENFINTLRQKRFKISNTSLDKTYRFEFTTYDKLIFVPSMGHLKPLATKEVIASFLSKKPINCVKVGEINSTFLLFVKVELLFLFRYIWI